MEEAATKQHAHPNTVLHCLYGFYCLGLSRGELSHIYHKSVKTIGNWINIYEATGTNQRAHARSASTFSTTHRQWLCDFFTVQPLVYKLKMPSCAHTKSPFKSQVCFFLRLFVKNKVLVPFSALKRVWIKFFATNPSCKTRQWLLTMSWMKEH
ncbi:hypothetical protein JG687_00017608 [Phytophthora cactorum]|uniref:Uncharacterized protein n=1 Tax=Phytophthora cactorum TaxID=29920 RepID=A0A8T1TQY4_9STRA|nr:hypothetical protein JG687_00017608 [Phytophthora cactorum]